MIMHVISTDMTGLDGLLLSLGLVPAVCSAVVIAFNIAATSRGTAPRRHWIRHPDEETLLLERFSRGEIDDDEYRVHREALRSVATPPKAP
jgi:uncharacterized membrane protein